MRLKALAAAFALTSLLMNVASSQAQTPVKIRIGWVIAPASIIPFMFLKPGLAQHNGKSYILEPVYYAGSSAQVTGLAAGDLEIATVGYSTFSIMVQNAGMKDLKIIADELADGHEDYATLNYVVRKDSPVQKVQDLKGRVVATNARAGGSYIPIDLRLRRDGLLPDRDYRVIETQFPNMKALLAENKADLITATTPFLYDPELQAMMRPLFTAKAVMGVSALSFWTARAPFIEKNRQALTDLMEDYTRATRWFIDPANRAEALDIISKFTKIPVPRLDAFVFTKKDFYRDPGMLPDFGAIQKNIDAQKEVGLIKETVNVSAHADPSLVKSALQRLK